mgnify:CR=1 FL=1
MQLKEKQIKEFQVLYKKNFGKKISKQKAIVDGMALIRLVYLTQPNYGVKKWPHQIATTTKSFGKKVHRQAS